MWYLELFQICLKEVYPIQSANLLQGVIKLLPDTQELFPFQAKLPRRSLIVIKKIHRTLHILEFKRQSDRNEDFVRVKEDEANEQRKTSSRRSKRQPQKGLLNRLILWQGGMNEDCAYYYS